MLLAGGGIGGGSEASASHSPHESARRLENRPGAGPGGPLWPDDDDGNNDDGDDDHHLRAGSGGGSGDERH